MSSPSGIIHLIGEIAAIIGVTLLVCLGLDTLSALVGFHLGLFTLVLGYAIGGAFNIGSMFVMIGVLIWALSRFRSEAGLGLIIGGVLLAVFPTLIPHYLGL